MDVVADVIGSALFAFFNSTRLNCPDDILGKCNACWYGYSPPI
jgi:hypothetical protein